MNEPAAPDNTELIEAELLAHKVIAAQPGNLDAINSLGIILLQQGRIEEAAEAFLGALSIDPEREDVARNLVRAASACAKTAVEAGQFDDALAALQYVIRVLPREQEILSQMAFVLSQAGRFHEALAAAHKAINLNSGSAHAYDVQGQALMGLNRPDDAIDSFKHALWLDRENVPAIINFGSALMAVGRIDDAVTCFDEAILLDHANIQAYNNLGLAYSARGDYLSAEMILRQAVAIAPDYAEAHFNLSRVLLIQGNYQDGWRENEWRWKCREFPSTWRNFDYPMWQGEELAGKTLLIWSEQGIGDEIMFANPIPDVMAAGADVVIECGERLVPVFQRSFENAVVVARQDPPDTSIEAAQPDFQTPLASLCTHLRKSRDDFANIEGRYLSADPDLTARLRDKYQTLGDGPVIGVCWRSGNPTAGHERSAPLKLWDKLFTQGPCTFMSLQYGDVADELAGVQERLGVTVHDDPDVDPFASAEDWFAQVATCDLVISIDNSTIQVSGSQGIPTWTMINTLPEWRFGGNGEGHDWHPYLRVFRQETAGDWGPLFDRVAEELAVWLALRSVLA